MRILYPTHHHRHHSPSEIFNGEAEPHQEVPGRLDRIITALAEAKYEVTQVAGTVPTELLTKIHTPEYITFLSNVRERIDQGYYYPSVFPYNTRVPTMHWVAELGTYSFDMYTPVSQTTWEAAQESAACAYQAAELVSSNPAEPVYALGRPPGHHAEPSKMGGYCYLNNAAVAAQYLSQRGRVATLDVDFHHGNGTQAIFYDRSDVFTVSLHADPNWKFPFFSGFADEVGQGQGEGNNLNLPLGAGTTNQQYQPALTKALQRIKNFSPDFLVLSLGLDIHEADPIGGFAITSDYFHEIGRQVAELELPTVIIQEGGYNTELLGKNVVSFLEGISQ